MIAFLVRRPALPELAWLIGCCAAVVLATAAPSVAQERPSWLGGVLPSGAWPSAPAASAPAPAPGSRPSAPQAAIPQTSTPQTSTPQTSTPQTSTSGVQQAAQ